MQSKFYKTLELLTLFFLIPVSFIFNFSVFLKLSIGVIGFVYIIYVLLKIEKVKFTINKHLNWKKFLTTTFIKLITIALITTFFVWYFYKNNLFYVPINKPKMWLIILFVYSFFSVYPQELMYRTFFFKRYKSLINSNYFFIFLNALLFSLAHLFFKNILVLVVTFIGGILFAITYKKTKSTLLVSIEHAIYGCWLFTVGMGDMLGFPS